MTFYTVTVSLDTDRPIAVLEIEDQAELQKTLQNITRMGYMVHEERQTYTLYPPHRIGSVEVVEHEE